MDRSARLKQLFAMLEVSLKRELTHEERHLLALSDAFCSDQDPELDAGLDTALGETAS